MFAVDGVKLPSNASREWSGSQKDYSRKIDKMERAVRYLTERHRRVDAEGEEAKVDAARTRQIKTLESAKMLSSKGMIQGYCAVAAVDQKHQIVVHAQAYGEGQEHGLLIPMLEGTERAFERCGYGKMFWPA